MDGFDKGRALIKNVRRLLDAGLTQSQVAKELGLSRTTLQYRLMQQGYRMVTPPRATELQRLVSDEEPD